MNFEVKNNFEVIKLIEERADECVWLVRVDECMDCGRKNFEYQSIMKKGDENLSRLIMHCSECLKKAIHDDRCRP